MGIKHYQEKNARAMEKELAQSDIPVKRKIQKTIQKYHISGKWYFRMGFWIFLFTGMSDWANSFSIGLVFFSCPPATPGLGLHNRPLETHQATEETQVPGPKDSKAREGHQSWTNSRLARAPTPPTDEYPYDDYEGFDDDGLFKYDDDPRDD